MASPVTPSDLPLLTEQADLCTRFSGLIRVYDLFREFLDWLLNDNGEVSDEFIDSFADRVSPIGQIILYASHTPPSDKWMTCTGQAISRSTYSNLFSRIGTTYGAGDNSTTFNLPDLRDRFPVGYGSSYSMGANGGEATVTLAGVNMPNHFHGIGKTSSSNDVTLMVRNWNQNPNGTDSGWFVPGDAGDTGDNSAFTAGDVATTRQISDDSDGTIAHNNLPPYLSLQYLIKVL